MVGKAWLEEAMGVPKDVLMGIRTGLKEGVKRRGTEAVTVGTAVEIPVGITTRVEGIGSVKSLEARAPKADSAADTRRETPVGMIADPRFARGRLMETGCPPRTGNPDRLPDGRARLVLDGANGVDNEGVHGVSEGLGSPEPVGRTKVPMDLKGTPRTEPERARMSEMMEAFIVNDRSRVEANGCEGMERRRCLDRRRDRILSRMSRKQG